jgi:hypothetical protein
MSSYNVAFALFVKTTVSADRDKTGQVINNFTNNAVKYSLAGTVINKGTPTSSFGLHHAHSSSRMFIILMFT